MNWAWQTVAHVILLQVALAFYVLVWPVVRKGAFLASRKLSKIFPDAEAAGGSASSQRQAYRGKWRDAQFNRSSHWDRTGQHERPAKPPPVQPQRRKHLATLGLKEPVHLMEIKTAYRQMAKIYHPDRFASTAHSDTDRQAAAAKMRDVNTAYDWLRANA
ncbi:MAG: DnaJ domain-containing protein [Pseudomonadota bacterium]